MQTSDSDRHDAMIAAMDKLVVAKHSMDAARHILSLAQRGYDSAANEHAIAAADMRKATDVFLGRST
jgi:hypothetical protein